MRKLWLKPWRDVLAMRWRALVICALIASGVMVWVGMLGASASFQGTLLKIFRELGLPDLEVTLPPTARSSLPALTAVDGVARAESRLVLNGNLELPGGRRMSLVLIGLDDRPPQVNALRLISGRYLNSAFPREVVVEQGLARSRGFAVGDTLTVKAAGRTLTFRVRGIALSPQYLGAAMMPGYFVSLKGTLAVVYAPLAAVQELIPGGREENLVNNVGLVYQPRAAGRQTTDRLKEQLEPLGIQAVTLRKQQLSYALFTSDMKAMTLMTTPVIVVFVAIAFVLTLISVARLVTGQRREIGALMALGYFGRELFISYLALGILLGLGGAVLGLLLARGVALAFAWGSVAIYGLRGVSLAIPLSYLAGGAALGLGLPIAATLWPVWRNTVLSPHAALAGEPSWRFAPGGLLGRLTAGLSWLPVEIRYALRGLGRRPVLTVATVCTVALSVGLAASWLIVRTSSLGTLARSYAGDRWDLAVDLQQPVPEAAGLAAVRLPGVAGEEGFLTAFGRLRYRQNTVDQVLTGISVPSALKAVDLSAGRGFSGPAGREAIISRKVAEDLGVEVGEAVEIKCGGEWAKVRVQGILKGLSTGQVLLPRRTLAELSGQSGLVSGFLLRAAAPAAGLIPRLYSEELVANVTSRREAAGGLQEYLAQLNWWIYAAAAMSVGVALLFLFSSINLNIMEREAEYATLQALGYGPREMWRMITAEAVALGVPGLILSVPVGIGLAAWLNARLGEAWIPVTLHLSFRDLGVLLGAGLLALPLAGYPAFRRLCRLNVAVSIRNRMAG